MSVSRAITARLAHYDAALEILRKKGMVHAWRGTSLDRRRPGVDHPARELAVVADDAAQGVTQVVRGADLLDSTARQIALQRAFGLPTPAYAHLPLVLRPNGKKLGKRDGALPLETLDEARLRATLAFALRALGQEPSEGTPRRC